MYIRKQVTSLWGLTGLLGLGLVLSCLPMGCTKKVPPTLTIEEATEARSYFERHLQAIGASSMGIPHTGYAMSGSMELMGGEGKNVFTIEQQIPNLYYIRISLSGVGVFERGFDGDRFWERTPTGSRFLSKEEQAPLQAMLDFQRWKNHSQWYPTLLHATTVEFGGETCTALTALTHDGRTETLLFSKNSGLLMGIERKDVNTVVRYGQYLPYNDIKIPVYWEEVSGDIHKVWRVDQFKWDRIEVDFRPPPSLLEER